MALYKVILSKIDTKSRSGDAMFPRKVVESYLQSERCRQRLEDRCMLGTLTHIHRYGAEEVTGYGMDDKLLNDAVILFCITKLWIEGDTLMAEIDIFDDYADYSEDQVGKIKQLIRLLKNKVNVPISIVTDADWDEKTGDMTYLYDIIGADVTLNPAFTGAKIISNEEN